MDPLKSNNLTDGDWGLDFKRKMKGDTFDEIIASRWLQQQQHSLDTKISPWIDQSYHHL